MREMLFRGFHPDENGKEKVYVNGKWIRGHWIEGSLVNNVFFKSDKKKAICYILNVDDVDYDCFEDLTDNLGYYEVLPETVGQYTGLTDKNGKKIFEGDILRGYHYPYCSDGQYNYFAEIVWFDNCPAFGTYCFKNPKSKVSGISDGNTDWMDDWNSQSWQVIGNIHSNPELLIKD